MDKINGAGWTATHLEAVSLKDAIVMARDVDPNYFQGNWQRLPEEQTEELRAVAAEARASVEAAHKSGTDSK